MPHCSSSLRPSRRQHLDPRQQWRASETMPPPSNPFDIHKLPPEAAPHHSHSLSPNQCSSVVVHTISAPVPTVWSLVRRFDKPQVYKHFIKACHILTGDAEAYSVGTVREVEVISGLPATSSRERLEILDDERYVISFRILGGEHRLGNYKSVTSLHGDGTGGTVVVESYVVDVPAGNTEEETRVFVNTIIRCNLRSLGRKAEEMEKRGVAVL